MTIMRYSEALGVKQKQINKSIGKSDVVKGCGTVGCMQKI